MTPSDIGPGSTPQPRRPRQRPVARRPVARRRDAYARWSYRPTEPDRPPVGLFDPGPRNPATAPTGPIEVDVLAPAVDTLGLVAFWRERAREAQEDACDARARVADLERVVDVQRSIEQAIGVLTVVFDVGSEAAADVLAWVCARTDAPLHVVARRLVDDARSIDYGAEPVERLTQRVADLAGRTAPPHG